MKREKQTSQRRMFQSLPKDLLYTSSVAWASRWLTGGKESTCQCRTHGFDLWVGKITWRRKWQPTPVFLPGRSYEQRSLAGYSPWGHKESDTTWWLNNNSMACMVLVLVRDRLEDKFHMCHNFCTLRKILLSQILTKNYTSWLKKTKIQILYEQLRMLWILTQ